MNTITNGNGYPIFVANQVLKYTDLNTLVAYLDQQTRLSRTHLIGIGIICGLEPSSHYQSGQAQITLSAGCGVTSEGYLITLPETVLTHYQLNQPVPATLFQSAEQMAAATLPLPPFKLTELFGQEGPNRMPLHQTSDGSQRDEAAFTGFLKNRVLVVVGEIQDTQRDSCLVDCDDLGQDRRFRPRFFLLPQSQETAEATLSAETLLRQGYDIHELPEPWRSWETEALFEARHTFLQEIDPGVLRFGYGLETLDANTRNVPFVRLTHIIDYKTFAQNYYTICLKAIATIDQSFNQLFRLFSPFFSPFHPLPNDFQGLGDRLLQRLHDIVPASLRPPIQPDLRPIRRVEPEVEAQYALQYFYDYLSQLVAAYRELVETAFDQMADCMPETRRFPRFLLLGLIPAPAVRAEGCPIPSAYRSHFTQPPLYNDNGQRVQQVRHLYERLIRLCRSESFKLLPFFDTPLKITPSPDRSVPLSEQAIPYYLDYPNLYRYWSYDDCRKGRSDRHPAYFRVAQRASTGASHDLIHRLDEATFYRIEGHIGEANSTALKRIQDYQQRYNLPFDVITLKLGQVDSLTDLTISGQFDDLEADFGRMRDKFQKLWTKENETWADNVFLHTLKRVFFDQPSLGAIQYDRLFNPVLAQASKTKAYHFIKLADGERYHLQVRDAAGQAIARFVRDQESTADLVLDFSGLSEAEIADEKERIREDLAAYLGLSQVEYGVEPVPSRQSQAFRQPPRYYVRLSVSAELDLPQSRSTESISLLTLNSFSISSVDNSPYIREAEFQDFETLYGLLSDLPQEEEDYTMGYPQAARCLNYFEMKGLMEAYQHRLEKLRDLHMFHRFAQYHPGMEHLGGVPKGGTFILVYVDGQNLVNKLLEADRNLKYQARTTAMKALVKFPTAISRGEALEQELFNRADIVIADFCLPYRCCSHAPVVNYLVTQPRPIVLLERTAFCAGDETLYEFILSPDGGELRGEGIVETEGRYSFQPSLITQIGTERLITLTYVVDGSYDRLTVAIYPEPEATLSLPSEFCGNASAVPIRLNPDNPRLEIVNLTIDGTSVSPDSPIFNPQAYATAEQRTVTVEVGIRDRLSECSATIRQEVILYPILNAEFTLSPNREEDSYYCSNEIITWQPTDSQSSGEFRVGDQLLSGNQIVLANYLPGQESVNLKLVYTVVGEGNCTVQSSRVITVFPSPNASFEPSSEEICSNDGPVTLKPGQPGGTFQALDEAGQPLEGVIDSEKQLFLPDQVPLGDADRVTVTIEYQIKNDYCEGSSRQSVGVRRAPVAGFKWRITDIRGREGFSVGISDITPAGDSSEFIWQYDPGKSRQDSPTNRPFTLDYSYGNATAVQITLTVIDRKTDCEDQVIASIPVPSANAEPPAQLFEKRWGDYLKQFEQLGTIQENDAYRQAQEVLTIDATVSMEEAIKRYDAFAQALIESYPQAESEHQGEWTQLMAISTARFLDRLVMDDFNPEMGDWLQEAIAALGKAGLKLSLNAEVWQADALRYLVDGKVLDQFITWVSPS